jgi:hypothetical protein
MSANKTTSSSAKNSKITLFLVASLTLGLAPFVPEPHIIGKVKWLLGGATGMQPTDWFDLFLHGTPWLLLFGSLILLVNKKLRKN